MWSGLAAGCSAVALVADRKSKNLAVPHAQLSNGCHTSFMLARARC